MEFYEQFFCRVYYEDTDSGGIVYHANYFKYIERARTESLRSLGLFQSKIKDQFKLTFVVKNIFAEFIKPAKLDDFLEIKSNFIKFGMVSIKLEQEIFLNDNKIFGAKIKLGIIDMNGKPKKLPGEIKVKLEKLLNNSVKILN